jgi:hypothetical protein
VARIAVAAVRRQLEEDDRGVELVRFVLFGPAILQEFKTALEAEPADG